MTHAATTTAARWRAMAAIAAACAAALLLTPLVGAVALDAGRVWHDHAPDATIFWTLRLPRVLLAAAVGAALATSGAVFQGLLRNPLATPFTLGVASGASLGAVAVIALGFEATVWGLSPTPLGAGLGALGIVALVLATVRARGPRMDAATLLLAGVTLSFVCAALILLLQYLSDQTETHRMIRWMMGGLETVGYRAVLHAAPLIALPMAWTLARAPWLNHLLTGDLIAASRGVPVRRARVQLMLAASLMTAAALAWTGPIGFVGLIVPHALRRLVGADHRWLLPACVLGGAALLPVCDAFARTALAPTEIPVGVFTALLGAPFFLALLLRKP